ncbi:MAG: TRAP transporter substrate-binding protein DctP [Deltaproteobacteria bacterium]|nr:TRAP transporter substrate-binding protein DctP [Deltaproteobacteria bacterium]
MNRRTFLATAALLSGFVAQTAGAAPLTIRFSVAMPPHNFMTKQCYEWAKLVEQNSGGELKVQIFDSAQLYKDNEVIKAVQTGAVDAALLGSPWLGTQLVPGMRVFQMPFLIDSVDDMAKVYHSKVGESWRATAERKGVKLVGLLIHPSPEDQLIATVKPVKVPADLKGMTIRVIGPDDAAVIKKWGAAPSFIPGMDVYPALQRGTIQGAIGSVMLQVELKRYEVAPYAVFMPIAGAQAYYGINKAFFDKLSPKQQKAIVDAGETMDKRTKELTMKELATHMTELKTKMKGLHTPTAQEMAQWKQGITELWPTLVGDNKDLASALQETRAILGN